MALRLALDLAYDSTRNTALAQILARAIRVLQSCRTDDHAESAKPEGIALHIFFVCTGNICRSPIAERLALAYGAKLGIPEFRTSSAGTRAVVANPIHPDAASVLVQLGGDASQFAARQLNANIALNADLVLTMTKAHRDAVLELAPRQLQKTFTLIEAARLASDHDVQHISDLAALRGRVPASKLYDIPDPMGKNANFFAEVGACIVDALQPVLQLCQRTATHTVD